jgi:hypothetical protein
MENEILKEIIKNGPLAIIFAMWIVVMGKQIYPLWRQNIEVIGQCIEVLREVSEILREVKQKK